MAEWIAWILEEDGRRVLVHAWDFVPGSNWIPDLMSAESRIGAPMLAVPGPEESATARDG